MNENNIIDALNAYDGTQPSLEKTVAVLSEEMGPDWTDVAFQQLGHLSVELKEKLNHAFNYYASLTAWQEAQSYLTQTEPLDPQMMEERLPVLKHWLDFFGQAGQDLYQQLEDHCRQLNNGISETENATTNDVVQESVTDDGQATDEEDLSVENNDIQTSEAIQSDIENSESEKQPLKEEEAQFEEVSDEGDEYTEETETEVEPENTDENDSETEVSDNTPEVFAVRKAVHEIALLDDLHAWLAARCVELGDIETFSYPYYGMLVDLMRQVVKDIQNVLNLENKALVMQYYPDGLAGLTQKKQAIEADIQTAVENCESDTTALIEKGIDMDKVKKALGNLDESQEKEYLGPAPDGFELLDNDQPIDEEAVKEQYKQLEENVQKNNRQSDISVTDEKKTSQNNQNGVQRKLSFSLKPKKG